MSAAESLPVERRETGYETRLRIHHRAKLEARIRWLSGFHPPRRINAPTQCADCRGAIELSSITTEPLCIRCQELENIHAQTFAFDTALELKRLHQVPVEQANQAVRPFGLGFGEIPSSKLVQALARKRRPSRFADGSLLLWGFWAVEGLLLLAVAAAR